MPDNEQITLIDVVGHRLKEKRRDEIALNIAHSDKAHTHGQVFRGTIAEIMAELKQ